MRTNRIATALLAAALAAATAPAAVRPPGPRAGRAANARVSAAARRDASRACSAAQGKADLAEEARRALARLPPAEQIAKTADVRVRRAVRAAYRAVAEIADSREPVRAATSYAKFERAYAAFVRAAARSGHKICARNCEADGAACRSGRSSAGKKPCGCSLASFACFVVECVP